MQGTKENIKLLSSAKCNGLLYITTIVLYLFSVIGCSNMLQQEYQDGRLGIDDAKRIFQDECISLAPSMKSGRNAGKILFNMPLGSFVPNWKESRYSIDHHTAIESIDILISGNTYKYRAVYKDDEGKNIGSADCYHKLIAVRNTKTKKEACYIVIFIPSRSYSDGHRRETYKRLLNSGPTDDFSGYKIWTRLDGTIVRINEYIEGRKFAGVNLLQAKNKKEYMETLSSAFQQINGISIQRGKKLGTITKSQEDDEWVYSNYKWDEELGFFVDQIDGSWYMDSDGDGKPDSMFLAGSTITVDNGNYQDPEPDGEYPDDIPDYMPSDSLATEEGNVGGGGGGGGGNGSGYHMPQGNDSNCGTQMTDPTPRKLSFKGLRTGYIDKTHDCMAVSKDIIHYLKADISDYKVNGCYKNTLFREENGKLVKDKMSTLDGIRLIKDYLSSNLPVVVGVHYAFDRKINDGTVDHWVVIYGYSNNNGEILFDYIDTNRGPNYFDQAYGDVFTFRYDKEKKWLYAKRYDKSGETPNNYIITVIRNIIKR